MLISEQQLIGLSVITKSGRRLGRVKGFVLDTENGSIVKYLVSPDRLIQKFFNGNLSVGAEQVLEITEKAMVVYDTLVKIKKTAEEPISA